MTGVPRLHDGRPLTTDYFSFDDARRRVKLGEKYGIVLAWSECAGTPGYSIILVKDEGIIARAISKETLAEACVYLDIDLRSRFHDRVRLKKNLVAVLNRTPEDRDEMRRLMRTPADALFLPNAPSTEATTTWFGGVSNYQNKEGKSDGWQNRAIVRPLVSRIG